MRPVGPRVRNSLVLHGSVLRHRCLQTPASGRNSWTPAPGSLANLKPRLGGQVLTARELPKRAGLVGPARPAICSVSADVLTSYVGALNEWEPPIEVAIDTAGSGLEPNAIGVVRRE